MRQRVKVMTVVVAYNPYRAEFFPRCLQALKALQLTSETLEIQHQILVVDNASSDDTRLRVRREFPHVEMYASQENLGYAGGNNIGFEKALAYQADFVGVVTQDVVVDEQWLLQSVEAALSDSRVGLVQPLLLLWPQKDLVNSIGNATHILGYGYARAYREPVVSLNSRETQPVPYASGACLLLSAKALREVGGFDEEMWMYNEDQDLGWRMWLMGYKNVMAPQSKAYHQYEFSRSISKVYFMDRNRLLVVLQNYHWASLLLLAPGLLINEAATFVLAVAGGWWREKIRVWRYFLRRNSWRKIREKRRLRQSQRTVKDKEIIAMFTGKILFQDIRNTVIDRVANPVLHLYWRFMRFVVFW